MHIVVFGGSFNPIHNGHLAIARRVVEDIADEVWLVVSPHNPFKARATLLADALRLTMVQRAVEGHKGLVCSDIEYHLPVPSYMSRTLDALGKQYPGDTFSLLIGADNWPTFPQWHNSSSILAKHKIYIYPRAGYPIATETLPPGVAMLDMPELDISATAVRTALTTGEGWQGLVPASIIPLLSTIPTETL